MQIESLDTNIIVRLITRDIEAQAKKAVQLLLRTGVMYRVDEVAVSETVYVLARVYHYGREEICACLLEILERPMIVGDHQQTREALELYVAHPSWSFDDCLLVVKTKIAEAEPLWTFDHKLAVQSGVAKEVK